MTDALTCSTIAVDMGVTNVHVTNTTDQKHVDLSKLEIIPADLWTAEKLSIITPHQLTKYGGQVRAVLRNVATWFMQRLIMNFEENNYELPLPEYSMLSKLLNMYIDESFEGDSYEWNVGAFDKETRSNLVRWLQALGVKPLPKEKGYSARDELESYWNQLECGDDGFFACISNEAREELWSFISGVNLLVKVPKTDDYVLSPAQLKLYAASHGIDTMTDLSRSHFQNWIAALESKDKAMKKSLVQVARLAAKLYRYRHLCTITGYLKGAELELNQSECKKFKDDPANAYAIAHYNQHMTKLERFDDDDRDLLPEDDCLWRCILTGYPYDDHREAWVADRGLFVKWE